MCQSRKCMEACTKRDKTETEMTRRKKRKLKEKKEQQTVSDIVIHDMVPVVEKDPLIEPSMNDSVKRPYSLPNMRKQIFINIEASPRNVTPSSEEEWFTPRDRSSTYCRIRRDSNENMFTFMVDEEHVKDVYVNYERVRSFSL